MQNVLLCALGGILAAISTGAPLAASVFGAAAAGVSHAVLSAALLEARPLHALAGFNVLVWLFYTLGASFAAALVFVFAVLGAAMLLVCTVQDGGAGVAVLEARNDAGATEFVDALLQLWWRANAPALEDGGFGFAGCALSLEGVSDADVRITQATLLGRDEAAGLYAFFARMRIDAPRLAVRVSLLGVPGGSASGVRAALDLLVVVMRRTDTALPGARPWRYAASVLEHSGPLFIGGSAVKNSAALLALRGLFVWPAAWHGNSSPDADFDRLERQRIDRFTAVVLRRTSDPVSAAVATVSADDVEQLLRAGVPLPAAPADFDALVELAHQGVDSVHIHDVDAVELDDAFLRRVRAAMERVCRGACHGRLREHAVLVLLVCAGMRTPRQ